MLTLGSLFDGISAFPLSASKYGIITKWASEIESFPIKVSQKNFPGMAHLGDVTKINGAEIEPVDIITFGSPCQDLSVAGKQKGLDGERSGLFMDAVRIIREMRKATNGTYPRIAIWENVPGAFSSNSGADFRAVLEEIAEAEIPIPISGRWAEAGMVRGNGREIAWRCLDAQFWGVPQRRKRIFLVTDFRGQCAGEILLEREGMSGNSSEGRETREEVAASAGNGIKGTSRINCLTPWDAQGNRVIAPEGSSPSLRGGGSHGYPLFNILENHPNDSRVKVDESGTVQTLTGRMGTGGGNVPMLMHPITMASKLFGLPIGNDVAMTLMATDYKEPQIVVFVANQKDEVRDLGNKSGALQAEPGMKQQTFVIQSALMQNKSQNGIGVSDGLCYTLDGRADHAVAYPDPANTLLAKANMSFRGDTDNVIVTAIDARNLNETPELSGTLQAKASGGYSLNYQNPVRVGYKVRRLTPTECLRLMGLPDDWLDIEGASDSAKYKATGNSVAIPPLDFIFGQIVKVLRRKD